MSYATPQDMIDRYPNRDLIQLTNEDPTATTVNTTVLQQALDDASTEIDGYLGTRFRLPLTDVPALLDRLACDIAMYRMQVLRPIHDLSEARLRYDDAIAMLTKVAAGQLSLGVASDGNETMIAAGAEEVVGPTRLFGRKRLRGF